MPERLERMLRKQDLLAPEAYDLKNCLLPLTDEQLVIVQEIMDGLEHDGVPCKDLMAFTSPEFGAPAEAVYRDLDLQKLTFENIWHVFQDMLPML